MTLWAQFPSTLVVGVMELFECPHCGCSINAALEARPSALLPVIQEEVLGICVECLDLFKFTGNRAITLTHEEFVQTLLEDPEVAATIRYLRLASK